MIFGGWGRKTKPRGEVFAVCFECREVRAFGLLENYGYAQLYGVRLAKTGTERFLACAQCKQGFTLTRAQWDFAMTLSAALRHVPEVHGGDIRISANAVAQMLYPEEAGHVDAYCRETLNEPERVSVGPLPLPPAGGSAEQRRAVGAAVASMTSAAGYDLGGLPPETARMMSGGGAPRPVAAVPGPDPQGHEPTADADGAMSDEEQRPQETAEPPPTSEAMPPPPTGGTQSDQSDPGPDVGSTSGNPTADGEGDRRERAIRRLARDTLEELEFAYSVADGNIEVGGRVRIVITPWTLEAYLPVEPRSPDAVAQLLGEQWTYPFASFLAEYNTVAGDRVLGAFSRSALPDELPSPEAFASILGPMLLDLDRLASLVEDGTLP